VSNPVITTLLIKDLRRLRANPWPALFNLALPLLVTALVGIIFSPRTGSKGLGQIKLAIVDQDDSVLGNFMRSAVSQGDANQYIEPRFLDRETAMKQILDNEISAVLIIPEGFTLGYLSGVEVPPIQLIKNPAQSFHPAIIEELTRIVTELLNAAARMFADELAAWRPLILQEGTPDFRAMGELMVEMGEKFETAEAFLFPPLVIYEKEVRDRQPKEEEVRDRQPKEEEAASFNLFRRLLPGLAAMFLFFLADGAIRDVYSELRSGTLNRFRTLSGHLDLFLVGKVLYAMVVLLLGALILFGGGALMFQFSWSHPVPLMLLVIAFCSFTAGFMAFLAALAGSERKADLFNSMIILGLSFLGGSFFPAEALPAFLRNTICPLLPNYWFIKTVQSFESGNFTIAWPWVALGLVVLAAVLVSLAGYRLKRLLGNGTQA